MTHPKKILAILPAYNEEETIGGVIDDLHTQGIIPIVVNDGSTDATADRVGKKDCVLVSHLLNRGQGAAIATGARIALTLQPDIVVTFDSDGQHQAKDIKALIRPIEEGRADVVLGSRYLKKQRIPFFKNVVLKLAIFYTRLTTGLKITDTHNGLRAFTPSVLKKITIRQSGMAHASEILDQIAEKKLRYTEVPVSISYSEYSLGKGQRLSNSFHILFDLWFK